MAKGYLLDEASLKRLVRAAKRIERMYPDDNIAGDIAPEVHLHEARYILLDNFGHALGASRAQLAILNNQGTQFIPDKGKIYSIYNSKHHMNPRGHLWSGFAFKGELIRAGFRGDKLYAMGSGYNNLTVTLGANLAAGSSAAATPIATHLASKSITVFRRATLTGDTITSGTIIDVEFDDASGIWKVPGVPCQ